MRRRQLLGAAAALGTACPLRATKRDSATRLLGVLLFDDEVSWDFLQRDLPPALAALGWQQGRNLSLVWRFANRDPQRLPALAAQLLEMGCSAILTRGTPTTRALQLATRRVPVVTGVGDPVGSGFAASLARPGSNITGLSYAHFESTAKRLELLRELAPQARRLLVVMPASRAPYLGELTEPVHRLARTLDLVSENLLAGNAEELRLALHAARQGRPARTVAAHVFSFGESIKPDVLTAALLQAALPSVFEQRLYVDSGGLASYRLNWDDQTRRTAVQLAKVLKGENPATIPFELPTRSELVVNARSAKALGLTVPQTLRARADEVIE